MSEQKSFSSINQFLYWIAVPFALMFILMYFGSLIRPFVFALVVWFLIRSVKSLFLRIKIKGKPLPRFLINIMATLSIILTFWGIAEIVTININQIISKWPAYEATLEGAINQLKSLANMPEFKSNVDLGLDSFNFRNYITGAISSVTSAVGNIIIIAIYVAFLVFEEKLMPKKIDYIYSDPIKRAHTRKLMNQIWTVSNHYMSLKTWISLLTGVLSYIVLRIFDVNHAFLWAFLIFLFNFIPYIGSLIATLLPAVFAVIQFGSAWYFVWVFLAVEAIQLLVGNIIEPRVMGNSLNLSPLVVILALSLWGFIWGVFGMLISVPITSIILIIMAQFPASRNFVVLCSQTGDISDLIIDDHEFELEMERVKNEELSKELEEEQA